MTPLPPVTVDDINAFMRANFTGGTPPVALEADGRRAVCRAPFAETSLRPGNTVSGPTMMALADTAAYVLVLSAIGIRPMALTTQLSINFLRMAGPNALIAEARMLKIGRTLAVCDVFIRAEDATEPCAHAVVTYALPGDKIGDRAS